MPKPKNMYIKRKSKVHLKTQKQPNPTQKGATKTIQKTKSYLALRRLKTQSSSILDDSLATNSFAPVALASTRWRLAFAKDQNFPAHVGRNVLAVLAQMKRAQILSRLVNTIQPCGKVHAALLA
jgi:hypothetical protein